MVTKKSIFWSCFKANALAICSMFFGLRSSIQHKYLKHVFEMGSWLCSDVFNFKIESGA